MIKYINDPKLSLQQSYNILRNDKYLGQFGINNISLSDDGFMVTDGAGKKHSIEYTNEPDASISWAGSPDIFLECSGKNTDAENCRKFLKGKTKQVVISATSLNADSILVYGYNVKDYKPDHAIVSYGSCTVNAFVPLAAYIHDKYGVISSSVSIIHNVPEYQLDESTSLVRKDCTLENVAPRLLNFLSDNNFAVIYTHVPYTGVSIIDYRFQFGAKTTKTKIVDDLKNSIQYGPLHKLYGLIKDDNGPEPHKFTTLSAVLVESSIRLVGDNLYIQAYFDNENSANRYFDLVETLSNVIARS